jgi:nitroreductase/FMN reductase [NAD(P)H]
MTKTSRPNLSQLLAERYGDAPSVDDTKASGLLHSMAARGSCRSYQFKPVPETWLEMLCAIALASPTKSDLQQRDIILLRSPEKRQQLSNLVAGQAWVAKAPMIAVFCGNNRRQRLLHDWHDIPFANDHLDALLNATGDAAIALGAFVTAAEALGLGCCPISAVRNEATAVSTLLGLPDHVFPFAGLAFGFPSQGPVVSKRLPLGVTYHVDQYNEDGLREAVQQYDRDRAATQPYDKRRLAEIFAETDAYTWSEDKVRQYSQPEREGFGDYVRARGFTLD